MKWVDKVHTCLTLRRRPRSEAYSDECLNDMKADYYDYIKRGATTSRAEVINRRWQARRTNDDRE